MAISYDDPFSYLELSTSQDCTKAGSTVCSNLVPRVFLPLTKEEQRPW